MTGSGVRGISRRCRLALVSEGIRSHQSIIRQWWRFRAKRLISKQCADTCPLWSASLHSDFFSLGRCLADVSRRSLIPLDTSWCLSTMRFWSSMTVHGLLSKKSSLSSVDGRVTWWQECPWKLSIGYILAHLGTSPTSSRSSSCFFFSLALHFPDPRKFQTPAQPSQLQRLAFFTLLLSERLSPLTGRGVIRANLAVCIIQWDACVFKWNLDDRLAHRHRLRTNWTLRRLSKSLPAIWRTINVVDD